MNKIIKDHKMKLNNLKVNKKINNNLIKKQNNLGHKYF